MEKEIESGIKINARVTKNGSVSLPIIFERSDWPSQKPFDCATEKIASDLLLGR